MTRESERNRSFSRRAFLSVSGGFGLAGLAGCTQKNPNLDSTADGVDGSGTDGGD